MDRIIKQLICISAFAWLISVTAVHADISGCPPHPARLQMLGIAIDGNAKQIQTKDGRRMYVLTMLHVDLDSPAEIAGIKTGDRLARLLYRNANAQFQEYRFYMLPQDRGVQTVEDKLTELAGKEVDFGLFRADGRYEMIRLVVPTICERKSPETRQKEAEEARRLAEGKAVEEQQRAQLAREREAQQAREAEDRKKREVASKTQTTAEDVANQKRHDDREARRSALLNKYRAEDFSALSSAYRLYQNPFAYKGKTLMVSGSYHKNLSVNEAIVAILPDRNPTRYIVQWDTEQNHAQGKPWLQCIVEVIGTSVVQEGLVERQIPHVKEVECLE